MEAGRRVIGYFAQTDATGAKAAVRDLNGADDQHLALMTMFTVADERIVFAATSDFGFANLG